MKNPAARRMLFLIVAIACTSAGCSTNFSTLKSGNQTYLYQLDEQQAFEISKTTMAQTLPGRKITEINGATKGFSTYTRFALDKYSQQIFVYPASGVSADGESVSGFYFEVSGSGTSGSGKAKNVDLWEALQVSLDRTGTKLAVHKFKPTDYASDNPFEKKTKAENDNLDVYTKLEKLKNLHDQGVLTDAEYGQKRAPLVDQL